MKKNLLLTVVLAFSSLSMASSKKWELNDVSILFGLPEVGENKDFLLSSNSKKNKGPLFPKYLEEEIRFLVTSVDRPEPENDRDSIRVVGARIDPCFKFTDSSSEVCTPQIRLVWQPTAGIGTKKFRTFDAAIHSFYKLTKSEFEALCKQLLALKNKNEHYGISTKDLPLNVHPAYLNKNRRKSFNNELKNILLSFAGEKNIVRFTFMKLIAKDMWWSFGGMDKDENTGKWVGMLIPRLSSVDYKQDIFNDDFLSPIGMKTTIIPSVKKKEDNLSTFMFGRTVSDDQEGIDFLKTNLATINRIENPRIHTPATVDCVHCHMAEPTRVWAEKKYPEVFAPELSFVDKNGINEMYSSQSHNLKNVTNLKTHNKSIRSFGYMDLAPSINQRAINESAVVADELNALSN